MTLQPMSDRPGFFTETLATPYGPMSATSIDSAIRSIRAETTFSADDEEKAASLTEVRRRNLVRLPPI